MKEKGNRLNRWLKYVYVVLMAVCLLWYLYSLATFSNQYRTPLWVTVTRCAAAGLAIWLGKMWKDKGFLILAAYFILILARAWYPNNITRLTDRSVQETLFMGVWLFGACYGLARVLDREELKRFLIVLLLIWTAGMAVYSLIGIYSAWTEQYVYTIGGKSKWFVSDGRLNLLFYYNTGASLLCVSGLVLVCSMLNTRRRWLLAAGVLALVIMLTAIALTDSRTEKISFSLGLSGMTALAALYSLKQSGKASNRAAGAIAGICFILIAGGMMLAFSQITRIFNHLKASGGLPVVTAGAESVQAGTTAIAARRIGTGGSLLNGREDIWRFIFEYIRENPVILLYGVSVYNPMSGPNELLYNDQFRTASHAHNTLIQVLLESGIPGLLLICLFLGILFTRGIRLIRGRCEQPKWIQLLPAAIFAVCLGEMIECFIVLMRPYTPQQALVFICMGVICTYGRERKSINA